MAITESVAIYHNPAFAGQLADMQVANKISKVNSSDATIEYGLAVVRSGEKGMTLPATSSTAANVIGVTVREYQDITENGVFGVRAAHMGSVLTMGAIWIQVAADVAAGDSVYVSTATATAGKFTNSSTNAVAISGAKFLTAGTAGGVAEVSFVIGG